MPEDSVVGRAFAQVARFNAEVTRILPPGRPEVLSEEALDRCLQVLNEEFDELNAACASGDVAAAADALVDLAYFALGRLVELGVPPGPAFDRVHSANMLKRAGDLSKRPGWQGHDAVKPEGWTPPVLSHLLTVTSNDLDALAALRHRVNVINEESGQDDAHIFVLRKAEAQQFLDWQSEKTGQSSVIATDFPVTVDANRYHGLREAAALRDKKALDYNKGGVALADYFPLGEASFVQMLHVKMQRLISLHGREALHESVRDTALDLVNYASFLVEFLDGRLEGQR